MFCIIWFSQENAAVTPGYPPIFHQVYPADLDVIVKANQICICTEGNLSLHTGKAAVPCRRLGGHSHRTPQRDSRLLVYRANQSVSGGTEPRKQFLAGGLQTPSSMNTFNLAIPKSASYSPSGNPPRGPQSDTSISLSYPLHFTAMRINSGGK